MILNFNNIKKEDVATVGGKGANLGEILSAGMNVPAGFVITAAAYKIFLHENGITDIIDAELKAAGAAENKLLEASFRFREMILKGKFPKLLEVLIRDNYSRLGENIGVAVRSSATAEDLPEASFAGQQETYLNVRGWEAVLRQILNCYASLWTDRAVLYRMRQGYSFSSVAMAVIIQEMVASEKAGVLFTASPLTNSMSEMQINANYGLGESVVSGMVTADSYLVDKSGKILDVGIGTKERQIIYTEQGTEETPVEAGKRLERVLSDSEVLSLSDIGLVLEKHYGHPLDIEWAIKDDTFYVLQARAITTLQINQKDDEESIESYIKNIKIKKSNRDLMSFLIEKMPFAYRALEYDYFSAEVLQKAEIFAESGVLVTPQLHMDDNGIMVIQNERKSINWKIFKIFKTLRMLRDFDYCAKRCREFLREYEAEVYKLQDLNFDYMDLAACKDFMHYSYELGQKISYNRFKYAIFPSVLNRSLKAAIRKVDINYTSFDLYWGLDNRTSLVAKEIKEIAAYIRGNVGLKEAILSGVGYDELCEDFIDFQKLTSRFLDRHGFKSDYNCYCVEGKTFIENPDRMLRILKPSISVEEDTGSETFERDFTEITNALKRIYGKKYARLESRIRHFRYFHFVREEGQYLSEIIYFHIRKCLKRINEILLQSSDYKSGIVNLFYEELIQVLTQGALSDSALQKIKRRNEMYPLAEQVWNASKLLIYDEKGDVLSGVSGNAGIAIGKVCVVRSPKEFYKVQRGDILVCPFTTPEWTTLFKLAGAVVADTGSALSHAAIVAREFGIPAVLGVGYATAKLKDGDMVRVDGNKGEVKGY